MSSHVQSKLFHKLSSGLRSATTKSFANQAHFSSGPGHPIKDKQLLFAGNVFYLQPFEGFQLRECPWMNPGNLVVVQESATGEPVPKHYSVFALRR